MFSVHVLLNLSLKDFEHYFTSMWNECNCVVVWTFFCIALLCLEWKLTFFQSCDHCLAFQICWHIECSILTAPSFRIWNSSSGIPSPPLALFILVLPKAHLTSHSRMSGSRWVITPLWLSWSWRSFLYRSSVYSCHLFLISSASVRSIPFLSFIEPIFASNVPLVSLIFLKRSSLSHSVVFLYFFCIDLWGRLSYLSLLFSETLHSYAYIFPFLLCFSLLFFSQLFERPPQRAILLFCISFPWGWSWSLSPVQCHEPHSIVHQALCLSDLVPQIYFSFPLYNHKGFDLGHTWILDGIKLKKDLQLWHMGSSSLTRDQTQVRKS